MTPDWITLSVAAQYSEPIRVDGWTAPAHCSFATRATLEVQGAAVASEGFDGPTSKLDADTGVLGAALDVVLPTTGEDLATTVPSTTVVSAPVPPTTLPPSTVDSSILEPSTVTPQVTVVSPDSAPGTTELPASMGQPAVGEPALVIAIAAFGQDQVATLELVGVEELESPWGTRDTQPLDGWTPLAVAVPADHLADPDRALEILRAVLVNDIVDPYLGALDPVFDSLVFLGPTEAAVLYQVGPSYHWEIGRMLLINGHWRVALGTMCRDLMDAAYTCDDVDVDPRPGPLG